jgi:arginine/lysine/ornithine decarboxylase
VLFILTIGNTEGDVERLVGAMRQIARGAIEAVPGAKASGHARVPVEVPPSAMTPRDAFYATAEPCAFAAATGRVSAEVVTPYPPGIPLLMPGEVVTGGVLDGLAAAHRAGCPVSASDPTLSTLRVLR